MLFWIVALILLVTMSLAAIPVSSEAGAAAAGTIALSPRAQQYYGSPQQYGPNEDSAFFYDRLSPFGDWLYLNPFGYVWVPRHMGYRWRPYSDGRWVWTEVGWTWIANEEWGDIPFHYGRWGWDEEIGWFWVPGSVWGPAWVSWRSNDQYHGLGAFSARFRVQNRNEFQFPGARYPLQFLGLHPRLAFSGLRHLYVRPAFRAQPDDHRLHLHAQQSVYPQQPGLQRRLRRRYRTPVHRAKRSHLCAAECPAAGTDESRGPAGPGFPADHQAERRDQTPGRFEQRTKPAKSWPRPRFSIRADSRLSTRKPPPSRSGRTRRRPFSRRPRPRRSRTCNCSATRRPGESTMPPREPKSPRITMPRSRT